MIEVMEQFCSCFKKNLATNSLQAMTLIRHYQTKIYILIAACSLLASNKFLFIKKLLLCDYDESTFLNDFIDQKINLLEAQYNEFKPVIDIQKNNSFRKQKRENGSSGPNVFLRFSRNRVDLLSYESKTTDKREQYDWRAVKIWTGSRL